MENDNSEKISYYAKKTFLAMLNPYGSVSKVFPLAINKCVDVNDVVYTGIKDNKTIPTSLFNKLKENGKYELHTLDKSALGGRAVDIQLINPITGNYMTGSSSGTAMNVFLNINDLGIGTDGGGSVLAPAMSLQLFGFISPLLEFENMKKFEKVSTDGLTFTPSIGFITRDFDLIIKTIQYTLDFSFEDYNSNLSLIAVSSLVSSKSTKFKDEFDNLVEIEFPDLNATREELIVFLKNVLPQYDMLISYEGPVDVKAMGDSVFGHFDAWTQLEQKKSGKGFIRVVNMVGASSICVPSSELGCGFVLICESKPDKIAKMLATARNLVHPSDELTKRYFSNLDMYFERNYGDF